MRTLAILIAFTGTWFPICATTLQRLGLGEMAQKSTAIARVKVIRAEGLSRGADVYTLYKLETLESLKSRAVHLPIDVAVPGGVAGGIRQVVAGAPSLRVGDEYVLFLWTSRSGLTQIIGLSQGVFSVKPNPAGGAAAGDPVVTRAAADEQMLDTAGRPVRDEALAMKWSELKAQVRGALRTAPLAANDSVRNR